MAILGMHRSGTSSLAGSLEKAGLYLGGRDVARRGRWNAKGNRESSALTRLHDALLEANGGSWDHPPDRVVWLPEHRTRRDRFIARRADKPRWGFKDPRTILAIDGWLEVLPDLEMVATIRHPAAVAGSLRRRAGSRSLDDWLELWLAYNERLLRLHAVRPFPIVDFDLPADAYRARLDALIRELRLPGRRSEDPFFEASLRNEQSDTDVELRPEIEGVYRRLSSIAARGTAALSDPADVPDPVA